MNDTALDAAVATKLATSFALSKYAFTFYKSSGPGAGANGSPATAPSGADSAAAGSGSSGGTALVWPAQCDKAAVLSCVRAHTLMKDLTETPALDMGPADLEAAARAVRVARHVGGPAWVPAENTHAQPPLDSCRAPRWRQTRARRR